MTAGEIPAERMSTNLLNIGMNSIEVNPFYWHSTEKWNIRNIDSHPQQSIMNHSYSLKFKKNILKYIICDPIFF